MLYYCRSHTISIHAPREGSDVFAVGVPWIGFQFLSTLPARGATTQRTAKNRRPYHFYPRSPRGERRVDHSYQQGLSHFYPRSPRGERPSVRTGYSGNTGFLSTLPARGATALCSPLYPVVSISIHAPREGSDLPHGRLQYHRRAISIHAPREGSDHRQWQQCARRGHFYPRSPRGERPASTARQSSRSNFYPRSPRGERPHRSRLRRFRGYFYPRSPRGERLGGIEHRLGLLAISIHAPREGSDITPGT